MALNAKQAVDALRGRAQDSQRVTDLRTDGLAALEWAAQYLERVGELPVLAQVKPGEIRDRLPPAAPDEGEPFSAVLRDLDELLLAGVTHWQHPRYFAYFATSSSEPAILAELLAATLNCDSRSCGGPRRRRPSSRPSCWTGPAELLGLPARWHGHIEDTASTSTMAAIIAAREATGRDVVACSDQAHSSVDEGGADARHDAAQGPLRRRSSGSARDAAGGRRRPGGGGRRDRRQHRDHVGRSRAGDRRCLRSRRAWLHVDAAYAGAAMVCPEHRWAFAGVDRADSLVVNAHKWMLTPVDCSLLWTSRPDDFRRAFSLVPDYLRTPDAEDALSLSEYGPALGRRFRALKLWAVLRCHGRRGCRSTSATASRSRSSSSSGSRPSLAGSCARRGASRSCAFACTAPTSATATCWTRSMQAVRYSSRMRS